MRVAAPASHLSAATRTRLSANRNAPNVPAITLSRLERAPHLPRELRPLAELCREASQRARMLERLRRTWRSSEPHAYWLHRAHLELAEHLLRDPSAQLPEPCSRR
jgi:hypothetical protein